MNVAEIMEQRNAFSFEVFPPKTDVGMEKLCGEGGVLTACAGWQHLRH